MANRTSTASSVTPSALSRRTLAVRLGLLFVGLLLIGLLPSTWRSVVILGIVEGLTEFLPISSTGHLLIVSDLLNFQTSLGSTFEIFIQLGAVLAVVGYYARDLLQQVQAVRSDRNVQRLWLGILVAFVPVAAVGLVFRDFIKTVLFESPTVIAWSLILGGVAFIVIERLQRQQQSTTHELRDVSLLQALGVGLVQILALIPGVSRSGASIIGGMLSGMSRSTATAFAFYLSIPTLGAATVVDLLQSLDQLTPDVVGQLLVGTLVSMVVAWVSIGWLLRYVATNSFIPFGIYRIFAGALILALVAFGVL